MYGIKIDQTVIERPQDTFMRVAIAINMNTKKSIEDELEYEELLLKRVDSDQLIHNKEFVKNRIGKRIEIIKEWNPNIRSTYKKSKKLINQKLF